MTLTLFDHVIAGLIVVGVPLWGIWGWRVLARAVATADPDARIREYRRSIAIEWGLVLLIVSSWLLAGRHLAGLGFQLPLDRRLLWGVPPLLGALAGLWFQAVSLRRLDDEGLARLRRQLEPVALLLPHDDREHRLFRWLALTAGTAEEVIYRGFLLWYAVALLGAWPGVIAAVLAFAAGHAYQGATGILKTGIVGALLTGLYILTGSLLWPMILHTAIDLQGGAFGRWVLGSPGLRTVSEA